MLALRSCDTVPALLAGGQALRVHSVFHRACNLLVGETLVTLLARGMPLAPAGCILDSGDLQALFLQGERIDSVPRAGLQGIRCGIELDRVQLANLRLTARPGEAQLAQLKRDIRIHLAIAPPEGGMYRLLGGHCDFLPGAALADIDAALLILARWLRDEVNSDALPGCLHHLVGFGIGLTPSSDDFLLGILFALEMRNSPRRSALVEAVRTLLPRTTAVSAAMLSNGCDGRYGEQLLALSAAIPGEVQQALRRVDQYGHSSGHDMLCGLDFALNEADRFS